MLPDYQNESILDFSQETHRQAQIRAIEQLESSVGQTHPLIIGGERVKTGEQFQSLNPSDPSQVIGTFQKGGEHEAQRAVESAQQAFNVWKWVPARERAGLLLRAANLVRKRRYDFNALLVLEGGKGWVEADADTAEAIDFLEFYAREAIRLSADQPLTPVTGEMNHLKYIPLGVGAVIPPWNFPFAILVGMTAASLVMGNTVVLKPASDTPLTATMTALLFEEAGLPPGALNLLTGPGPIAGEAIVGHPQTRFIAFTGSREVGLQINELAAKAQTGQTWIKRAILEMGGKDFIIVDSEADLAAAVASVAGSAFGYQGQKCSACSRAIVDAKIYDDFVEALAARVEHMSIGAAKDPDNFMGPVINQAALKKTLSYIDTGRGEGQLVTGGERAPSAGPGHFVQPTVFKDVSPTAKIAREEIFGPVLAVIKAGDFDEAVRIANDSDYGLTGAFYTRNRQKIARGRRYLHCGNLYVNRKCTGALVGAHPFGGFQMSGTDSKAGGRDYLLLFSQAKSISEKLT